MSACSIGGASFLTVQSFIPLCPRSVWLRGFADAVCFPWGFADALSFPWGLGRGPAEVECVRRNHGLRKWALHQGIGERVAGHVAVDVTSGVGVAPKIDKLTNW